MVYGFCLQRNGGMVITHKQRLYAQFRAEGLGMSAAALAAGYSEKGIHQSATKLEKHPKVIAHIKRLGNSKAKKAQQSVEAISERATEQPAQRFDCPLEYMRNLMNQTTEDPKLRLSAASALASFTVAKAGDKTQKEKRKDEAEKVIRAQRFGTVKSPLKIVT